MIAETLKGILELFYPRQCAICENILLQNENVVCLICRHDLPILFFKDASDNAITKKFKGRIPLEKANTLFSFTKNGKVKKLIHDLKYRGNEEIGKFIGNWLGEVLIENKEFSDIDFIVPVPLHQKKQKARGYNQLTKFGERLSFHLNKPLNVVTLLKTDNSNTQTFKHRFERFENIKLRFSLINKTFFTDKHVLLIDDVLTTGATLEACSEQLLKTPNIKISILTMSLTQ